MNELRNGALDAIGTVISISEGRRRKRRREGANCIVTLGDFRLRYHGPCDTRGRRRDHGRVRPLLLLARVRSSSLTQSLRSRGRVAKKSNVEKVKFVVFVVRRLTAKGFHPK